MNRRAFMKTAGVLSAAGAISATNVANATAGKTKSVQSPAPDPAALKQLQNVMGYSDQQFQTWLQDPRNQKILSRLGDAAQLNIVFEVVKAEGCIVDHKVGEKFIFPRCGALDMKNSASKLCPFLMPPMARMNWVIQERVWEGLDPNPLFYMGQCDDVGSDCGGWGRVVIVARIEKAKAAAKS
jgi:hypothetical protein